MRAAGRFPRRVGKEFVRNLIRALLVYVPIAAFFILWPVAPLGGVLIFVSAVAVLITVVGVWAGGDAEAHDGGYGRSWSDSGHRYSDYPGIGEGGWYDGGHHGAGDRGYGHGGGDGGGGF